MIQRKTITGFLFFFAALFVSNYATGQITLGSYNTAGSPMFNFQTYTECMAGQTKSNVLHVQYSGFAYGADYASGYTLTVQANSNFTNGSYSIPANEISLKFNNTNAGPAAAGNEVLLSVATAQTLVTATQPLTAPPTYSMDQGFDVKVYGGNWLLVPIGTYSANLTFRMYDTQTGNLLASISNVQIQIQISYDNSCGGLTLAGNFTNGPKISSYDMVSSGATAADAVNVQYTPNGTTCAGWSLRVHASGNFMNTDGNSSHYIEPSYVSLAFDQVSSGSPTAAQIGVTGTPVTLSTTDVTLINNSQAGFNGYTAHAFNMTLQGGNYLLARGTGTFTTNLIFSVYNQGGGLVATYTMAASVVLAFSYSNSATITLTDPDVLFQYNTSADYANSQTVTKTQGLEIKGYSAYYVNAEVTYQNFTSGSNTLTPSVLQLTAVPNPAMTGLAGYTIPMSYNWQKVIQNPMTDYTYQDTKYDLIYTIPGGNSSLYAAPAGSYTNQVIFQYTPQ